MNVHCDEIRCDNNTMFSKECMFGITEDVIRKAIKGDSMCPILKNKVVTLYDEVSKVVVSEIMERLTKEAQKYGIEPFRYSESIYTDGVWKAIEIVKEVGGIE